VRRVVAQTQKDSSKGDADGAGTADMAAINQQIKECVSTKAEKDEMETLVM